MKRTFRIIGYCILFFCVLCVLLAIFYPKENTENIKISSIEFTPAQKDSIKNSLAESQIQNTIRAKDLYDHYEENEIKADENFKGKNFYVQGRVQSIANDILNEPYVTLNAGNDFLSVQCSFADKKQLSELKKGDQITVYGECNGKLMNVQMQNCSLAENIELKK